MRKIILFVLGIVLFQTTYSQNNKSINWNKDLDYLFKELSEKHYNFFTIRSKDDFLYGINAIKLQSENLTDLQTALKAQQLIAKFGDSHTMLNFMQLIDNNKILPMHLIWTSDGLHIIHTTPENKKILENRLLSINKIPISTVIDSLSTLFTVDNQSVIKSIIPKLIPVLQVLEYFGFADTQQVELGLNNNSGQNWTYVLKPAKMDRSNRVSFNPDSLAFSTKNENTFFTDSYYPDEKIYYMLYNRCWSKEIESEYGNKERAEKMPSFKEFETKAFNVLNNKPVDKIIFDLRYNGGGSSRQGTEFIEKLAKFLEEHPAVQTYVVLGRGTFSSAILNAMDFKRLTNATFVGEETAGKPNHFGEVRNFRLPDSNLNISYSTKYFKRTEENINTISPDIIIEMSFSDLKHGIDPVYEWIKKQ